MMASTVADNVSRPAAPLSVNPSKNPLRLRARAAMIASAYTYLAGNEAAYWTWRAGGTPLSVFVRRSAPWQHLLWRVRPPALPRDRELAALRKGIAG